MGSLPDWTGAKRVAVDIETCDPNLKTHGPSVRTGGFIAGVAFAIEGGPKAYLPMRHQGGDNLPVEQVRAYLKNQLKDFDGDIVGANFSYDMDYLLQEGIHMPCAKIRDIQIAEALIWEHYDSYSLDNIGKRRGFGGKDEEELRAAAASYGMDPKADMWKLPARFVGRYAEHDCALPLEILRQQEKDIEEQDLHEIWDLESRVLPVLVKMKRRGVRINQDRLQAIVHWVDAKEAELREYIKRETGVTIGSFMAPGEVAPVLLNLGVALQKNAKDTYNVDKFLLGSVKHPVAKAILEARKVGKLRDTFAKSIIKYMVNGRIHCTFNQLPKDDEGAGGIVGAKSGRLSAQDPNMQQQPSRDEFAARWRSIYEPEEGQIWGSLDYSQQEPRWTTHFAARSPIEGKEIAQRAAQAYHDDPKIDNHQFMADLTGLPRKYAKNLYLGLCYGEGGAKLSHDLELPTRWAIRRTRGRERAMDFFDSRAEAERHRTQLGYEWNSRIFETGGEEAQKIIDTFNARAPFIKQLANLAQAKAEAYGFIRTVLGRRCRFPKGPSGNFDWTYKALNRIIQGSSADQVKKAIVLIDQHMPDTFINLQVHDELDGSFRDPSEAKAAAQIMIDCIPNTAVPFRVDVELGPSWGEAK